MLDHMPPLVREWLKIWLVKFLKDLYHEIKMVGLKGGKNLNSPYSQCANHGNQPLSSGIDMTLNIPTSLTMAQPGVAPHLNPNQINLQTLSTVSLQFLPSTPVNPGPHSHHTHGRSHNHSHSLNHGHSINHSLNHSHSHNNSVGLGVSHSLGLSDHNTPSNMGHNPSQSLNNGVGSSGSHNHTNSHGLGGSHNHTNSLGLNASHCHKNLSANPIHTNSLGLGGCQSQGSNLSLGGSHCHSRKHGLGSSHSSTLGGNHSHSNNPNSSQSHNISLGLGGNNHNSNHGVGGSHSHTSLSLSDSHGTSLGLAGNHCHSTNIGLGSGHSLSTNSGLGGAHSHTLITGIGGSHNHGSSLALGGPSLISSLSINTGSRHNNLSINLGGNQNLNCSQNIGSSQNGSSTQTINSSQNLSNGQTMNSQQNLSNSYSNSHNHITHKSDKPRRLYSSSNCGLSSSSQPFRLLKPARRPVECYHPSGAATATYMPSTTVGTQSSSQTTMRVQQTPQPSAPPAPQQDIMSKTTMAGHNFVSQTQTQPRQQQQYANFQFRTAQHGSRPNSHPRQQQPSFISGGASSTGPVMYPTFVLQPAHMGMQTYQQPRSGSPAYYQYHMGHYIGYNNPPSHTPPYYGYPSNSPQLPTSNIQSNSNGGRSNSTAGSQGSAVTPTTPAVPLTHTQPLSHMQTAMPGIRPAPVPKRSHRLAIIDPVTKQDILSETSNNDTAVDQVDRQTPQPYSEPAPTRSIAEEFTRMVNNAVNQPTLENAIITNFVPINELPLTTTNTAQSQNAISSMSSNNNHVIKSDLVNLNDNRNLGADVAVTPCDTPVVSAISDSPVIVPKMTLNVKPIQKNESNALSSVIDTSKNTPINKNSNKSSAMSKDRSDNEKSDVEIEPVATTPSAVEIPTLPDPSATLSTGVQANPTPMPQRLPRERVHKSEDKDKHHKIEKDIPVVACKPLQNGPTLPISLVDSFQQAISTLTSQTVVNQGATGKKQAVIKPLHIDHATSAPEQTLTATELLSASIEKVAREKPYIPDPVPNKKSSAFEAQAKLTQSISSVCRVQQSESKMKDINLKTDPDNAIANTTEVTKTVTEDINNEKAVKNTKNNNKKAVNMANSEVVANKAEPFENGYDTDKEVSEKQEVTMEQEEDKPVLDEKPVDKPDEAPAVFLPKYKYTDEQWSPFNKSGKKCYDIGLLKQIKEDPLSKNKPNAPLLEACNVIRTAPMQEPIFTPISRPVNDALFPPFLKGGLGVPRNTTPRDPKKDGRNMVTPGKGSVKLPTPGNNSSYKPVIHVSLSLREDVKLNEVDSAWKPTRFRKDQHGENDVQTQELNKKFRGILNKLTPQKFDTLVEKVKNLEINNQKRLEGVIDLLFEKAIEEPNFSEAYAAMCNKLSTLKVASDSNPEQYVNFRGLIINKCQKQFETGKSDEQVRTMEKELAETADPIKKKELQLMINEENRKVRLRSVANVRFIGELYKLKMLTGKIMDYCMNHLVEKLEEEKLECLCKLLTTIGEQVENERVSNLDILFKKMQEIVDRRSNKISSRVKFMIQDVIDLRRRKWVIKSVVDSQPKMMDQIQKEAEQQARHIELMNASGGMGGGGGGGGGGGSFRRDDGGRGKRGGDNRRQNAFMDNNFPRPTRTTNFSVDTNKLKTGSPKNLNDIRLGPTGSWNHGAQGAKAQQAASSPQISFTKNKFSGLENVQMDPSSLGANFHSKGASIERSTFNSRADFASGGGGGRSGSVGVGGRSASGSRAVQASAGAPAASPAPQPEKAPEVAAAPATTVAQEPLPGDKMRHAVKSTIDLLLFNADNNELAVDVKQLFEPQYHAAVVAEILNILMEKNAKEVGTITQALFHLVASNVISPDNFIAGLKDTFEYAPDLYIDIPMLYDYLGKILAPHIEKKHLTLARTLELSETIKAADQGHLLLKSIIRTLTESMGPTFVKSKWQESGLQLSAWMSEEQGTKWIEDNKFEFLEGGPNAAVESTMSPAETQARLLQLMNSDESCDCIKGWIQDKFGKSSNEEWLMRTLIQAICEHALYGNEGRDVMYFNQDRMSKYAGLIHEFGETKQAREANCLFGIQQLIHRLEHPQGLTLEIFQYLHEQYLISLDGFIAWEVSEKEPEGKGVMLKALTSFFTNIKEADNEDSGSED